MTAKLAGPLRGFWELASLWNFAFAGIEAGLVYTFEEDRLVREGRL
jgi:hypothetical protein